MKPIILASASPRRREICELLDIPYTVCPATGEEPPVDTALPPEEAVLRVARAKAEQVAEEHPGAIVLGADTVVLAGGRILGKPRDEQGAAAMLRLLSGREHRVVTAVWVCGPGFNTGFWDATTVEFAPLSEADIAAYVASGEPMDKAGAYAVQGKGARYIRRIDGDFYTVMGLPAARLYAFLCAPDFDKTTQERTK